MGAAIAVVGAGLIGQRHVEAIEVAGDASLACIVDPSEAAREFASARGLRHFASIGQMLADGAPGGAIIATPNAMHVDNAAQCIGAGLPVLVEKPIATDASSAEELVESAEKAGVPLLVGHHRRHNPLIQKAHEVIQDGGLGQITAVQAQAWLMKPDEYFDVDWRRKAGAGPIFLNLIHDVDLLAYLCGDIASVHAMQSSQVRGNAVEDTAAVLLRFASGALGTVSLSDTIVAPWSWELTARENPAYPATGEDCYWIGGTKGSLSLPNLSHWSNPQKRSWWEPIGQTKLIFDFQDPLVRQVENFAAVIARQQKPLVTGRDGLRALRVIEAIKASAESGRTIDIT